MEFQVWNNTYSPPGDMEQEQSCLAPGLQLPYRLCDLREVPKHSGLQFSVMLCLLCRICQKDK